MIKKTTDVQFKKLLSVMKILKNVKMEWTQLSVMEVMDEISLSSHA